LQPPPTPVPVVDRPVAVLPADWSWPPNLAALIGLLSDWPSIRAEVPGATLLLAGPHLPDMSLPAGVTALGRLPRLDDLWASAAVLAFPCPSSSGPKVKVLEAAMVGVPVVTTPAGVEGLELDGVVVSPASTFAATLTGVLGDPARRSDLADRCRTSAIASHAPVVAATRRLTTWNAALDASMHTTPGARTAARVPAGRNGR
jgi:glycosyltransferase involved in cell wall biosynthesis